MAEEFFDVTVKVPSGRLAEFYEAFGRWLQQPVVEAEGAVEGPPPLRAWDPSADLAIAAAAWDAFPARARLLFGTLIDQPGRTFTGAQLADLHDIPNGMYGVAGVLAWPGRQLRARGRSLPLTVDPNPSGGSYYSMSPRMARLFEEARRSAEAVDRSPVRRAGAG